MRFDVRELLTGMGKRAIAVIAILIAAALAIRVVRALRTRAERRILEAPHRDVTVAEHRQRIDTVLRVGSDVARFAIILAAAIAMLGQLGVSVQPFVAGAGLLGAALALGSQTVVKDFVAGFFILLEGHFAIGDEVVLGPGLGGIVERMTLRVTVLRDDSGSVHIVPNGSIGTVTNRSYHWTSAVIELAIDSAIDVETVRGALTEAVKAVAARATEGLVSDPLVEGPTALRGSSAVYRVSARTLPHATDRVRSMLIEAVTRVLRERAIEIRA